MLRMIVAYSTENDDTIVCLVYALFILVNIFTTTTILFIFQTRHDGRFYLEFARDNYQNYDFENRLNVRIHAALRLHSDNVQERIAQQAIIRG